MARLDTPIRKNDSVVVITGKDRGKRGRVLKVLREKNRLIVEGVNIIKRHTKPNPQRNIKGGLVEREAATARLERAAGLSGVRQAQTRSAAGCSATGARSASAASAREWSTNEPPQRTVPEGSRAGPARRSSATAT